MLALAHATQMLLLAVASSIMMRATSPTPGWQLCPSTQHSMLAFASYIRSKERFYGMAALVNWL